MPSSFDPLGLVKAMGPQRDPYSWAELYAQDASKGQQLREEMKLRLMLQEKEEQSRKSEHEKDRGSRMGIVEYQQRQMNKRAKMAATQRAAQQATRAKDIDWPAGTLDPNEARDKAILESGTFDRSKYIPRTRYGITKMVPIEHQNMPMSTYPELTPSPVTRDPYHTP